jgi:hypothetical protein
MAECSGPPQSARKDAVGMVYPSLEPVDSSTPRSAPLSRCTLLRHSSFVRAVCVDALVRICAGGDQRWPSLPRQLLASRKRRQDTPNSKHTRPSSVIFECGHCRVKAHPKLWSINSARFPIVAKAFLLCHPCRVFSVRLVEEIAQGSTLFRVLREAVRIFLC